MVASRIRWAFSGLVVLLSVVLACGGGGGSGGDDDHLAPDASVDECALTCPSNHDCCDINGQTYCIDTTRDDFNCGECGKVCSKGTSTGCGGGECKCGAGPACEGGKTCISEVVGCRDMKTDPQNCGTPGHKCLPEETCSDGVCSCGGETCGNGETCCSGHCVNTKTDADNCGTCHQTCEGDEDACTNGACTCPGGGHCSTPTYNNVGRCCGMGCNNVCTDVMNCGACGHACTGGATCNLGGCSNETNPDPFLCTVFNQ
jgi:hypothetical protein